MRKRSKALLRRQKFCLTALSVLITVTVCECLCRLTGRGQSQEVAEYIADWQLQWNSDFYVLKPDFVSPGERINSDGLRDRERRIEREPDARRIVCLGDSVTYGFNVKVSESYPAILEAQLQDESPSAEALNVALPGWCTRQQRIAYQRIARKYQPDCVILGICLNDVAEMQNNMLQPPPALMAVLYRHSHLARFLIRPHEHEIHRVEELFECPEQPQVRQAWSRFLAEIQMLADEVENDGARFVGGVFPFRFQVLDEAPPPVAQQIIRDFCRKSEIPFLDALPTLASLKAEGFIDYDHLSPLGATAVARRLVQSGLLSSK